MAVSLDKVVGVRVRGLDNVGFYDSRGLSLRVNERVEVETGEGSGIGRVVIAPGQVLHADLEGDLPPVLGAVTPEGESERGADSEADAAP